MDPGWYYSKLDGPPGQQSGPVSWEQLVSYARSGFLVPEDLVRSEGSTTWHPAAEIPGLLTAPPVAAHQPPAPSPSEPAGHRRSRLLLWLLPLIAVLLVGAGLGAYFGFRYQEDHHDLEALAFTQQEGEIFLEAAGVAGPGSFTEERFVSATPSTSLSIPSPALTLPPVTSTTNPATSTPTVASGAVVLASYAGDTPALYGGSKSKVIADKESELLFLEQNPLKAAAFCEALNSDPTLRWSGGTQVRPDQLRDYFAELTPLLLTRDTRVTNYGYRDGHPTPRQSVLQAGQMVLVDRYGVPRKRCECGNPLTPPLASRRPPVYTGPKWTGFNPGTIIIIQQTTVIINDFTVIDINTGQPFGRPAGTAGASDGKPPGGSASSTSSSTATTQVPSTLAPATAWKLEVTMRRSDIESLREMNIAWNVEVTADTSASLSGNGPGGWHVDGTVWEGQTQTGTFSADAYFGVQIGGGIETTEEGRTLRIQQKMTDYQIQNLVIDTTSDRAKIQASIEAAVPEWLNAAFTDFLLPADTGPVYGYAQAGGYEGSANLLPVR